jgi:hypothetical protein
MTEPTTADVFPAQVSQTLAALESGDDDRLDAAWTRLAHDWTWPTANAIWQEACRQYDERHEQD